MCVCAQKIPDAQVVQRARGAKPGYLTIDIVSFDRSVVLRPAQCGSGILSFFGRFRSVLLSGEKTETRRVWSNRTPNTARYMSRMRKAYEARLFVRMWCAQKLIGWGLLTGWKTQRLQCMKEADLVREGYGGKSKRDFFKIEFGGVSVDTSVLVISFVLFPSVVG